MLSAGISQAASDSPQSFTFQGRLFNSNATDPLVEPVILKFQIYDPSANCLLYQETQSVDLTNTQGVFSLSVGSVVAAAKRTVGVDPSFTMAKVFKNDLLAQTRPTHASCPGGYTPSAGDHRLLRVTVTPQSTGIPEVLSPDQVINSVPHAIVAETLQGLAPSAFIQKDPIYVTDENVSKIFGSIIDGVVDASALHHHDGRYIQISSSSSQNLGSGGFNTSGKGSIGSSVDFANTTLSVKSDADTNIGLAVRAGSAGQTADLFQVQNSAGVPLAKISNTGGLTATSSTISSTAGNQLAIDVNGTGTSSFTASGTAPKFSFMGGNVGIGTTSPVHALDLVGSLRVVSTPSAGNLVRPDNAGVAIQIKNGSNAFYGSSEFKDAGGTDLVRITNTGNVGIGTTSPGYPLSVIGTGNFAPNSATANNMGVYSAPQTATTGTNISFWSNALNTSGNRIIHLMTGNIAPPTGGYGIYQGDGNSNYFSGNVGIGTTTPSYKMDVNGVLRTTGSAFFNYTGSNVGNTFIDNSGTGGAARFIQWDGSGSGTAKTLITANGNSYINGGNVGIGTTTPAQKLTVENTGASGADAWIQARLGGANVGHVGMLMTPYGSLSPTNVQWSFAKYGGTNDFRLWNWNGSVDNNILAATAAGNVGIGTTAPTEKLTIIDNNSTPGQNVFSIKNTNASGSGQFSAKNNGTGQIIMQASGSSYTASSNLWNKGSIFTQGNITELKLLTNGDVTSGGTAPINFIAGGYNNIPGLTVTAGNPGNVGIGTTSPQTKLQVAGVISPATNNAYTLGDSTYRFTEVFATNGVISTSDLREKKEIKDSDLGVDFINKLRPVSYRWNTGVDEDVHYGLIAQEAEKVLKDKSKTSIISYDKKADRYGVRYSELISPLIKAVQELYKKVSGNVAENVKQNRQIASLKEENNKLKRENLEIKAYLCSKDPKANICK